MVSIIIPVFNEQARLKSNLEVIFEFLKGFKEAYEVVIVNDGSKDKTREILEECKDRYNFALINHPTNLGKGAAIKTGVNNAKGDLVLFTDIDLSVPIEFLDKYLAVLDENTDIIIGTRASKDSVIAVKQFWLRELLGAIFTRLTNIILWIWETDFTCGFKLFRTEAAVKIFNHQRIKRWAFDAESLFLAKYYGFAVKEVAVVWRHGEGSKVRFPMDLVESFFSLFLIRINAARGFYD